MHYALEIEESSHSIELVGFFSVFALQVTSIGTIGFWNWCHILTLIFCHQLWPFRDQFSFSKSWAMATPHCFWSKFVNFVVSSPKHKENCLDDKSTSAATSLIVILRLTIIIFSTYLARLLHPLWNRCTTCKLLFTHTSSVRLYSSFEVKFNANTLIHFS